MTWCAHTYGTYPTVRTPTPTPTPRTLDTRHMVGARLPPRPVIPSACVYAHARAFVRLSLRRCLDVWHACVCARACAGACPRMARLTARACAVFQRARAHTKGEAWRNECTAYAAGCRSRLRMPPRAHRLAQGARARPRASVYEWAHVAFCVTASAQISTKRAAEILSASRVPY